MVLEYLPSAFDLTLGSVGIFTALQLIYVVGLRLGPGGDLPIAIDDPTR